MFLLKSFMAGRITGETLCAKTQAQQVQGKGRGVPDFALSWLPLAKAESSGIVETGLLERLWTLQSDVEKRYKEYLGKSSEGSKETDAVDFADWVAALAERNLLQRTRSSPLASAGRNAWRHCLGADCGLRVDGLDLSHAGRAP